MAMLRNSELNSPVVKTVPFAAFHNDSPNLDVGIPPARVASASNENKDYTENIAFHTYLNGFFNMILQVAFGSSGQDLSSGVLLN